MRMSLDDSRSLTSSGNQARVDMHAVKMQEQQRGSATSAPLLPVKMQEQQRGATSASLLPVNVHEQAQRPSYAAFLPVQTQQEHQQSYPTAELASVQTQHQHQNEGISSASRPSAPAPAPVAATYAIPIPAMASAASSSKPGYVPPPIPPPLEAIPMAVPMARDLTQAEYFSPMSILEAFALHLVLGFVGTLHFRMGRYTMGFIYLFTAGGFGIGWVVDLFRLPLLVNEYNAKRGLISGNESKAMLIGDTYAILILWFIGGHHFFLKRTRWGFTYFFTLSLFGIGFIFDLFRVPLLVDDFLVTKGQPRHSSRKRPYLLSDAVLTWFPPAGLLGAHHLYLGNGCMFVLYFCTLGLFGVGWLLDMFRLSTMVQQANDRMRIRSGIPLATA